MPNPLNTDDFSTPGTFVPLPSYVGAPGWTYAFSSGFDVLGANGGGVFAATNTNTFASYLINRVPSTTNYTVDGNFVYQAADAGNNKGTFAVAARFQANGSFYWAGFVSSGVNYAGLDPGLLFKTKFVIGRQDLGLRATGNVQTALAAVDATGRFNLGDTANMGLIVRDTTLAMTLNGVVVLQTRDSRYAAGRSGLFVVGFPVGFGQVFMQTFQFEDSTQGGGVIPGGGGGSGSGGSGGDSKLRFAPAGVFGRQRRV